jgi:hypothetical protein
MLHLYELYERDMIINETIITPTYPRTTFAICFWQFAFVKQFIFFFSCVEQTESSSHSES